jgi:hypothetical protein
VSVAYLEALATFARTKRLPGAYVKRLTAEAMLVERVQRFGAQVKLPLGGSNAD